MTQNIKARLRAHRSSTPWYHEVDRVLVRPFDTAIAAATAKHERIRDGSPRHNRECSGWSGRVWASRVEDALGATLFALRLPHDLHDLLKAAAEREHRSLHGQIIHMLREAFANEKGAK